MEQMLHNVEQVFHIAAAIIKFEMLHNMEQMLHFIMETLFNV
jgi:hypothetical protein